MIAVSIMGRCQPSIRTGSFYSVVSSHVQMIVNLSLLSVLSQESPEDSLTSHPENFSGHPRFGGTLSLARTSVSSFGLGSLHVASACSGVNNLGLLDDNVIAEQLLQVASAVGIGDDRKASRRDYQLHGKHIRYYSTCWLGSKKIFLCH